jgi:hypothetical protein
MVVWLLRRSTIILYWMLIITDGCMSIYEGSIVVLYWTLTIMNGWMSNTKGTVVLYWMLNYYGMFVYVLQRIYYRVTEC